MTATATPRHGTVYQAAMCMNCHQGIWARPQSSNWVHHDGSKECVVRVLSDTDDHNHEDPRIADAEYERDHPRTPRTPTWRFDNRA